MPEGQNRRRRLTTDPKKARGEIRRIERASVTPPQSTGILRRQVIGMLGNSEGLTQHNETKPSTPRRKGIASSTKDSTVGSATARQKHVKAPRQTQSKRREIKSGKPSIQRSIKKKGIIQRSIGAIAKRLKRKK